MKNLFAGYRAALRNDGITLRSAFANFFTEPVRWRKEQYRKVILFLSLPLFAFMVDEPVRTAMQAMHNSFADVIFNFGHWFGTGTATLYLFLLLYFGGLIFQFQRFHHCGLNIGLAFILSGIITVLVKSLAGRWRPFTGHGHLAFFPFTFGPNEHLSMPSGHVTIAFALSSVMAAMYNNYIWKVLWYCFAVITAISRIYHDQHWLSDVLLSAIIGTMTGIFLIQNQNKIEYGN
jgi:membrane-associated phospholipid phosphatase